MLENIWDQMPHHFSLLPLLLNPWPQNLFNVLEGIDGVITFAHGVLGVVEPFHHAVDELVHRYLLVVIHVEVRHHLRRRRLVVGVRSSEFDLLQELLQLVEGDHLVSVFVSLFKQSTQIKTQILLRKLIIIN